ncbi:MAG: oligopeptidase B, partial [Bradymonadaceae bacterium]
MLRHRGRSIFIILSCVVLAYGCATSPVPKESAVSTPVSDTPPVAKRIDHQTEVHGQSRVDPYHWMREKENPETIAYLEAENAYTSSKMAHTEELQKSLYDEILGRIEETDLSVPVRHGDYFYYTRTEEGKDYPIHCRKLESLDAVEEILLDQNALAEGHEYFSVGDFEVSDDHRMLAYSIDTRGDERYTLYFKNLETGELKPDAIENTGGVAWANDHETVFYTTLDDAHRPDKVFRHRLGTATEEDVLILHEEDDAFYAGVNKTRSGRFLLLSLYTISSTEVRYLDADNPTGEFEIIAERRPKVEYSVEHHGDHFLIVTNEEATNFKLMRAPVENPQPEHWEEMIAHRPDVMLRSITAFKDWFVISEREAGVPRARVRHLESGDEHYVEFPEEVYHMRGANNPEFDTQDFRLSYSSLVTPQTIFDYQLETRKLELMKETEVKNYDRTRFETSRLYATAADGTRIPIS